MKLTSEQIKERFEKLPKEMREAIFSVDSSEAIQAIGKKYKLAVDKIGELADEIGLVTIGATPSHNFVSNLSRRLGVDREKARKIAQEINEQVFAKIREKLKKL